jgi:hypothetical protein
MDQTPLGYMGPPPFRFSPRSAGASGPAFSMPFKIMATLIVLGCTWAFIQMWLASKAAGGAAGGGWFIAGLLLVVYTWFCILRSTTSIDAKGLHQTWVWDKHMELNELAYGKMIRVRGLDWLIAPRLYVRTLMGKFTVFYAASPDMVAEFERLVAELKAFRSMR